MGKAHIPQGRAAFYRLQAELARRKAGTMADVNAREMMLEVAKTLDTLAEIEERMTGQAPENKDC
jgi:hypothetical protein